jgi:hypothetical protein
MCPHCDIRTRPDGYNREEFLKQLNAFDGRVTLFGGEPTLYQDRLFDIIEHNTANNIKSISTNLVILNDRLLEFYKSLGGLASSWNPNRFTNDQYKSWLTNLNTLAENNLKPAILITLTNDLFDMGVDNFISTAKQWNKDSISYIKFEYYVGDTTKAYYEQADNFLCELYENWDLEIKIDNIWLVNHGYCFVCSDIRTLSPDGTLSLGCPHGYHPKVPVECYSCEKASRCKPCRLQPYCSFPHKFEKLIKEKQNGTKENDDSETMCS